MTSQTHHLMVGSWTKPGGILTIKFDESNRTLELVKRTETPDQEPLSWITFSHDKKTIYGASMKMWRSFAVHSPSNILHASSKPLVGSAQALDESTTCRAIFTLAERKVPYNVLGVPFYDYATFLNVYSTNDEGTLQDNIQNLDFTNSSAAHCMVYDAAEEFLYTADLWGNKIWIHKKNSTTGLLDLIGTVDALSAYNGPRWVCLHPNDKVLYVVMETGNQLCVYDIDPATRMPVSTTTVYPLVPPALLSKSPRGYRSDTVFLSASTKYLFATSRCNTAGLPGYIYVYELDEAGHVVKQIQELPTSTSGGQANAISPCPWSDEWVALCDQEHGWIEMYRWHDEQLCVTARLRVDSPGFCMNAIWYD